MYFGPTLADDDFRSLRRLRCPSSRHLWVVTGYGIKALCALRAEHSPAILVVEASCGCGAHTEWQQDYPVFSIALRDEASAAFAAAEVARKHG